MKTIPLSRGVQATVDDADYDALARHKWFAQKCANGRLYAARKVKVDGRRTVLYMHHVIAGKFGSMTVDHRSGDTLDDRRGNLRICSYSENELNSSRGKMPGVFHCKTTDRYAARASLQGRRIFLGRHDTFEQAAAAVQSFRSAHIPAQDTRTVEE